MSSHESENGKPWTFITSHGQVLLCLARDPSARLRDVADSVGITERAVQRIVADLVEEGYVERSRFGRRNRYLVHKTAPMRHRQQQGRQVRDLLELL
jgi:DNA-binding MarR family transcriptional regulator